MRMTCEISPNNHFQSDGLTSISNGNVWMGRVDFPRGDNVCYGIEKVTCNAIEHFTFVRYTFRKDHIECADPIGNNRDHQFRPDGIHVPDFALVGFGLARELKL